ncbi:unnamed protein product, partial [Owenia fusiformis]
MNWLVFAFCLGAFSLVDQGATAPLEEAEYKVDASEADCKNSRGFTMISDDPNHLEILCMYVVCDPTNPDVRRRKFTGGCKIGEQINIRKLNRTDSPTVYYPGKCAKLKLHPIDCMTYMRAQICEDVANVRCRPLNGGWGSYRPIGACSEPCGGGITQTIKYCDNPTPEHGGLMCIGSDGKRKMNETSTGTCNRHECSINGGWGDFSEY